MSIQPVPHPKKPSLLQNLLSGGVAGIISKTVVAPVERVKLLMQTQVENTRLIVKYTGVTDCLTRCIK
jgi:solute carrier family 25 (adenine nucleotide translocator) protein 4/5/6/31